MHELSLLADLMKKIDSIAAREKARKVTRVRVKLGAFAHISADHFREHFEEAARDTIAAGAVLDVEESQDQSDPNAQDILLDSVEVET